MRTVLERLHAAGLDSVPGGGAEILDDRVRRKIAKAKCTSEEWLGVMRTAHQMGLRSSCTMMYGTIDEARDRINHLVKLRELQDETGGFTAFFCWDFQHEQGVRIEAGDHGTNNADDDIEDDALLSVGAHDEARKPAADTADDQPNDDTH